MSLTWVPKRCGILFMFLHFWNFPSLLLFKSLKKSHLCDDLDDISDFQLQFVFMLRCVAEGSLTSSLTDLLSCIKHSNKLIRNKIKTLIRHLTLWLLCPNLTDPITLLHSLVVVCLSTISLIITRLISHQRGHANLTLQFLYFTTWCHYCLSEKHQQLCTIWAECLSPKI